MADDVEQRLEAALARWMPLPERLHLLPLFAVELAALAPHITAGNQRTPAAWHHANPAATMKELKEIAKHASSLHAALNGLHAEAITALADNGVLIAAPELRALIALLPRLAASASAAHANRVPPADAKLEQIQQAHQETREREEGYEKQRNGTPFVASGKPRNNLVHGVTMRLFDMFGQLREENPVEERQGVVPVVQEVFDILGIDAQARSAAFGNGGVADYWNSKLPANRAAS